MSKPEEIKKLLNTFITGAMGAMTFGAYHQYTTNKIMELNNQVLLDKFNMERELMTRDNKILMEKIIQLEKRRWF